MKRRKNKLSGLILPLLGALLTAPAGCAADGLIGGECAEGFEFCAEECISTTDDEKNCGGCDIACGRNLACVDSLCGGPDGTIMLPGTGGGGTGGSGGTGGIGFGGVDVGGGCGEENCTGGVGASGGSPSGGGTGGSGGGASGGSGGTGGMGPVCTPPYNAASSCGDCDTQCAGGTPNCAPDGGGSYECVANCLTAPFLTQCGAICIDPSSDPRHCGTCNNRCDSGICAGGSCVGKVNGHMVAICMSFESQSPSQTNILGNAVFLASGTPVRILAYTRDTSAASISGTNLALSAAAVARGQSFQKTEVTGLNAITSQLDRTNYDVLIIYDQQKAPAGRMASRAAAWGPTVQAFTQVGGVVIVLSGGGGTSEAHELIEGLGIVTTSGVTNYDGGSFDVTAPGDALAIGVISPFLGVPKSCVYSGTPATSGELVYVTEGAPPGPGVGDPGVVHRIIVP